MEQIPVLLSDACLYGYRYAGCLGEKASAVYPCHLPLKFSPSLGKAGKGGRFQREYFINQVDSGFRVGWLQHNMPQTAKKNGCGPPQGVLLTFLPYLITIIYVRYEVLYKNGSKIAGNFWKVNITFWLNING